MLKLEASGMCFPKLWMFGLSLDLDGFADPIYAERPSRRIRVWLGRWQVTLIVYRMSARKWAEVLAKYERLQGRQPIPA